MPEQQKATKVTPPRPVDMPEPDGEIVDVDMTTMYTATIGLSIASLATTYTIWILRRKIRKIEEDAEALRAYITSLVNGTECGQVAYQRIVDAAEAEESTADVSEDFHPYPEQEEFDEPCNTPRRRARDVRPIN